MYVENKMFYENQEQLHGSTREKNVYRIPCLSFGLIVTVPHLWPDFWAPSYPWYFLLCEFSLLKEPFLLTTATGSTFSGHW